MADTHTIMPKSLAQALMSAGMKHFDFGGMLGGAASAIGNTGFGGFGAIGNAFTGQSTSNGFGLPGQVSGFVGNELGGLGIGKGANLSPTNGFSSTAPGITTQNFQPQIANLQGQQQNAYNQQQNLAQTLLAQSQGQGPNPAQAALNQSTGNNIANQAALMASQRGAGANAGLLARQAAQQGATTQQQAVGQGAQLQAQQQLAAQNALQGVYGNEANQALQGESIQQGGEASQNSALTTGQLGSQNINANVAGQNASTRGGILGGVLGGVGSVVSGLFSKGGVVEKMASGGEVNDNLGIAHYEVPGSFNASEPAWETSGGKGLGAGISGGLGNLFEGMGGAGLGEAGAGAFDGTLMAGGAGDAIAEAAPLALAASKGGKIPFSRALLNGGKVPGKASVQGDSEKNDTQPTLLSPGEEVLPRSITMAKNAPEKAAEFVRHLQKEKPGKNYGDVVRAKKSLKDRVEYLEKCMGGRV